MKQEDGKMYTPPETMEESHKVTRYKTSTQESSLLSHK